MKKTGLLLLVLVILGGWAIISSYADTGKGGIWRWDLDERLHGGPC